MSTFHAQVRDPAQVQPPPVAPGPREIAAEVQHLTKVYFKRSAEPVLALSDVSVELRRRQVLALVGPSGCGKSTLLRILAGLDRDFEGAIRWEESGKGRPVSATVFQQDSLFPWLTVERNVDVALKALGLPRAQRAERARHHLELTGLGDFRQAYPHELSGGMRQRACFARALATEPLVLLLDEPFAALDAQTRIIMQQELGAILERVSPTVLYVTHDLEEALTVGDRVALMSARPGRISYLLDIDHGSTSRSDVMAIRARRDFREQVSDLWHRLASEVGQTLRSTGDSAASTS
jgi:NitT/TauT family transport system ATP-binding protein